MTITVDIADRRYDYTDEEKAADAVSEFQAKTGLSDAEIISIWQSPNDPMRLELEKCIFDAVDANGTAIRASQSIPCGLTLLVDD